MSTWNRVRSALQKWRLRNTGTKTKATDQHLLDAHRNLQELLADSHIPAAVRAQLAPEFEEVEKISEKLSRGEVHIAVYGRVGVGKSSLLNALLDKPVFSTSPLHGETLEEGRNTWVSSEQGHVVLVDTPGIDELDGQSREELARKISRRADVVIMVCDGDLTDTELAALQTLRSMQKLVLLVLNKADRYSKQEQEQLLARLQQRCADLVPASQVLKASADPRPETVIRVDENGRETEQQRPRQPEITELKRVLLDLLEREGKALAALNASLFASELDTQIATRIVTTRKVVAEKIIRKYCLGKSVLVAANPVPVADLLAAAGVDIAMVIHLGQVYGFQLTRSEASRLLLTISAQLVALMGAYWGVNLVSSALKTASAGLSTVLTATAQGALAWYATYLTGKMAQSWFSRGKSWGGSGPRETAREILASLDRDSLLRQARDDISSKLAKSS